MLSSSLTNIFAMPQPEAPPATRRTFLKLAGAGLVLGLAPLPRIGVAAADTGGATGALAPNPYLKITPDGLVTVVIKHLDKGQGAATGLATLVAEELDASWDQIRTEFALADAEKYKNFAFGVQGVGGSTGLSNSYKQYRQAGATARAMLVAAAAKQWGVAAGEITVKNGVVTHSSGKEAKFGALAIAAAAEQVPTNVLLKTADQFVYIGKPFPRVDTPAKSSGGVGMFTIDIQMDGMLVAVMARPPKFGATTKGVDTTAAMKVPGVVKVIETPRGVAVLATSTWPAIQGRNALVIDWDDSKAEIRSSDEIIAEYTAMLDQPGKVARNDGDADAALKSAAKVIEAEFEFPYLAHAPMEPVDCVVKFDGTSAELWTGSQLQTADHGTAAAVLGLKPEAVKLNTVWAGGSFGRRAIADCHFVAEACMIAKALGEPRPVKLVWTREDDIKGGYYRPLYVHRIRAGLDGDGKIVAWHHHIVGQSILAGTFFEAQMVKDGIDATSVEGASTLPYQIPNLKVELTTTKVGVPVLWWRSVGSTHTAHATEHMIDIIAQETKQDPVALRLALLEKHPRHAGALKLAAEKAEWSKPLPEGKFRGAAVHESFKSFVAQVAEIALDKDGGFKVERVVCAVDCGIAVNPDVVAAQMEGGLGYGLSAALSGSITLKNGEVEQSNFDDYTVLRINDMPKVETYIVPSAEDPTGVGEPGTPPVLPAVANALLAATGIRSTTLPLKRTRYFKA